jgi:hypothetical protein
MEPASSEKPMNPPTPFNFYTERRLVQLTGIKAHNLLELLEDVQEVPGSSIFYHTHHRFLSHHFQKPLVYNDFAVWVSQAIQEEALSEKLGILDLRQFTSIRQLRECILSLIEAHLQKTNGQLRECLPGQEFNFCKSKSFIMPTGIVAENPADLLMKLPAITNVSLYFHFVEARLRMERLTNDFSQWLNAWGEKALAREIDAIDPYALTLDELKLAIVNEIHKHGVA